MLRVKKLCLSGALIITFWIFFYNEQFGKLENDNTQLVPNIVHYVVFNQNKLNFITYLSLLSTIKVQKPSVIYIHTNKQSFHGFYWDKLVNTNPMINITLQLLLQPTHVYGQRLSSIYHASDVTRLYILRTLGGIYLDTDMLVLKNLNDFRKYDAVVGWPKNQNIGTQIIVARKNSEFLKMWQEGYKKYRPRDWYYNAGQFPTELLIKTPYLAHYESEYFGVHNLLEKLLDFNPWIEWKNYYSIHVLRRHNNKMDDLDEISVQNDSTNFSAIARWILSL